MAWDDLQSELASLFGEFTADMDALEQALNERRLAVLMQKRAYYHRVKQDPQRYAAYLDTRRKSGWYYRAKKDRACHT